ncbi:hypothetical protein [Mycoplasma suis]|uniref:Uncharacterized protein n=2 Tax=Mycoplasma suis TaxID=57372 RepID=F0QQF3_MYCSL|nr:hypothetical protein [Mycoplasma suis]ADX97723.1 hypothetical protein MSU_0179 [Mycoplasma suis str. Illinois]CBZ40268.1 hypothetical protein MSUIS_01750 [Mycoplasma suis KI3806]
MAFQRESPFNFSSFISSFGLGKSNYFSNSFGNKKEELGISSSSISSLENNKQLVNNLEISNNSISVEESFSQLGENELLVNSDPEKVIQSVFSEVNRNSRTKQIEEKSSSTLKEVQSKLTEFNKTFEEAVLSVKDWEEAKVKNDNLPISHRDSTVRKKDQKQITVEQRKALFNFYKEFCGIKDKQFEYSGELSQAAGNLNFSESSNKKFCSIEVVNSLEQIGWNREGIITFGDWLYLKEKGNDPFSILLESEKLKKFRDEVVRWTESLERFKKSQLSRNRSGWGDWMKGRTDPSLGIFEKEIDDLLFEMSMEISNRLLEQMSIIELMKSGNWPPVIK